MTFCSHNGKFILDIYFHMLVRVYTRKLKINLDENGVELQQRKSDFLKDRGDCALQHLWYGSCLDADVVDKVWWCIDELLVRYCIYNRKLKINLDENGVELQQRKSDFLNDGRDSALQNLRSVFRLHDTVVDKVWWCIDELLVRY